MNQRSASKLLPIAFGAALLIGCGSGSEDSESGMDHMASEPMTLPMPDSIPQLYQSGEALFNESCVTCHGPHASGTDQGPPLVHIYYEPNHHADFAFMRAVQQGVRAHHWNFGDMPPVAGRTPEDVVEITAYIRFLQREAGIY